MWLRKLAGSLKSGSASWCLLATVWANLAPVGGAAAPVVSRVLPNLLPCGYVARSVQIRADDLRRFGRTAGCRTCTLMTNGEAASGVPRTRACQNRFEQAMVEASDDRV